MPRHSSNTRIRLHKDRQTRRLANGDDCQCKHVEVRAGNCSAINTRPSIEGLDCARLTPIQPYTVENLGELHYAKLLYAARYCSSIARRGYLFPTRESLRECIGLAVALAGLETLLRCAPRRHLPRHNRILGPGHHERLRFFVGTCSAQD